ncbi:hypothetical protein Fmac_006480 [Flemingia macrophylla]|uniref:ABC transporter domain-containing protein n=1 Tax=Flemingia macrophylla TaxID=520843 RepID=A0ABD1NAS3_9FABA
MTKRGKRIVNDLVMEKIKSQSWSSRSLRMHWTAPSDMFDTRDSIRSEEEEEALKWAAIQRLPTLDRMRKGMMSIVLDNGRVVNCPVDVTHVGMQDKKHLLDSLLKFVDDDNEKVGIQIPNIEVRYENVSVEGNVYFGSRALPTLLNVTLNIFERILGLFHLAPSKKRKINILKDVSGIIKPSRMTLLLGPPGAGKTTLLLALSGKLDPELKVSGKITYCGHELNEFVAKRTCAYIGQHDLHYGEMTVRETLDFSGRCLGVGTRYDMVEELLRREKQLGIKPDPEIDAFMKATSISGQKHNLQTDYILKILGLDICADTMVGDNMRRGISGGQKKRVTTGEMLVGPAKALFMDEISTGLDSSTTFQVCKFMRQMVHIMDETMVIALLQPAQETFELFDDIILLSEGQIVYQGPREHVLEFFEQMGFKCPPRKGVADFLQEVTSTKDQSQYWFRTDEPYRYVSVPEFAEAFHSFHIGEQLATEFKAPYDKRQTHPAALVKDKYGISNMELLKACFSREWLLMKRNIFFYAYRMTQLTILSILGFTVFLRTKMPVGTFQDGNKFFGALFFSLVNIMFNGGSEQAMIVSRLPVFYKQRDFMFYPGWAFGLPKWILGIPISFLGSGIWTGLTYYTIGFAPSAGSVHEMALSLFRVVGVVGRSKVVANILSGLTSQLVFLLGGFVVAKNNTKPWISWGYYVSPMMYGQTAMPNTDPRIDAPTVGKAFLKSRGFHTEDYWFWICIGALFGFVLLFNTLSIVGLTYMKAIGDSQAFITDEDDKKNENSISRQHVTEGTDMEKRNVSSQGRKGMVLPFQPLSLAFNHIDYYVDMPSEMESQGITDDRLQLLHDASGAFRPGVLTALMGVSGAGKTTLMDVLAGRKTGGYIEGSISISGYPKNQATFARVSGYCEQNDIHSPYITVYESLLFSAWLRLPSDINEQTRKMFVEEVMELVELNPIRNALVGLPGVDGLSTEQRKRLTIAVELVANPSIIFMDEPTSGLDARAAAIVMRTVRNTVDTGRTVVCTIHQPSIDIFEAFDEVHLEYEMIKLLLMKRGGQVIYAGPLGHHSQKLVEYFGVIEGVPKIKDGNNPAAWMLEVSTASIEAQIGIDFVEIYANSTLYQRNQELIKELSSPAPGSSDLSFPSKYSQSFFVQLKACFWKQYWSYWRNPPYNAVRYFFTIVIGLLFGVIFWQKGKHIRKQQDFLDFLGAMYAATIFIGTMNAMGVQPIIDIERTVLYRERAAGMYSAMSYAISQVLIEAFYVAIQSVVYCLIMYSMMGLEWKAVRFFSFLYFMFTCLTFYTLYGMTIVSLTPSYQIAAVCNSFFSGVWNVFTGFLIPRTEIPIWWRWYYWATPNAWTLYGLVTSQFGDKDAQVEVPGSATLELKELLKKNFGYDYGFLPVVTVVQFGWVLLFLIAFANAMKFLNFQKR